MIELGLFISQKSVNKFLIPKGIGGCRTKFSSMLNNSLTKSRTVKLCLITLAIDVHQVELLKEVCNHLKLES
jgi:hypothetical protein